MPGRVSLTVRGDNELRRKLKQLDSNVRNKAQLAAVLSGALLVANDAKSRAPILTGTLRRSIHIGGHPSKTPDYQPSVEAPEVQRPERLRDTLIVFVGTNLVYAAPVEFGTSRMGAQPYLRPALDNNRQQVIEEMSEVLRSFIEASL